ncbi:MAG: DUF1836 domain-containing protein [Clostridiales Family XIII bacterium]|jgi:hypothetical protein|nr:DUF1836 domain-containing protein [Clostridiales Family XIII bacterium]
MRYEEYLREAMDAFTESSLIEAEDFPDIELYADQVIGFLNEKLKVYGEEPEKQIISKTMISNYIKHNMLPRPVKKKYNSDHMIMLALIFHLRNTFRMNEIELIMKPFLDNYDSAFDDKIDFRALYKALYPVLKEEHVRSAEGIMKSVENVKDAIWDEGVEDDDTTELFSVLLSIALQMDAAKYAARKLLDEYYTKRSEKHNKKSSNKK